MADTVAPEVRSRMMAGIRGRDTRPELVLRTGLHNVGFRYRLHAKDLLGKPDMVFPKYRAIVFAHGCFWHGHDCALFKWPKTRQEFWKAKINGNRGRDERVKAGLIEAGWRVLTVWECALRGPGKLGTGIVIEKCATWLTSRRLQLTIAGRK